MSTKFQKRHYDVIARVIADVIREIEESGDCSTCAQRNSRATMRNLTSADSLPHVTQRSDVV